MRLTKGIDKGSRVVIISGTGGGKSTLAEMIVAEIRLHTQRILILDSKPRFNPTHSMGWFRHPGRLPYGRTVDAVEITSPQDLTAWWKKPTRIAVARRLPGEDVPYSLGYYARMMYEKADGREAWVVVDEGLDFFSWNGAPSVPGKSISQIARNGREKGLGLIQLAQRVAINPKQLMADAHVLCIGRLGSGRDRKDLIVEYGVPRETSWPTENMHFTKLVKPYGSGEEKLILRVVGKLSTAERRRLPASQFADPDARKLPIEDAEHVRAAIGRFNQTKFDSAAEKAEARRKILAAAEKYHVKVRSKKVG